MVSRGRAKLQNTFLSLKGKRVFEDMVAYFMGGSSLSLILNVRLLPSAQPACFLPLICGRRMPPLHRPREVKFLDEPPHLRLTFNRNISPRNRVKKRDHQRPSEFDVSLFHSDTRRDAAIEGQAKVWRFTKIFDLTRTMQRRDSSRTEQRKEACRLRTGEHLNIQDE